MIHSSRLPRAFRFALLLFVTLACAAPAQAQYRSPTLRTAGDGPVQFITLANDPSRFPGLYHGNVMFRGTPSPGNPQGLYAYTMFGAGNLPGSSNTLAGVPQADGNYSAFVPGHLPIVVGLVMARPVWNQPWASVSTGDPTNLAAEWSQAPDYTPTQAVVQVRQGPGNSVELGFSWIADKVKSFIDNPLRIRVTNVCRG
jgi:hypothetical protein